MPKLDPSRFIFAAITAAFIALLSLPVMARALFDYLNGGSGWRQGDWLINFGEGFVRRGLFGEIFIVLSDLTGLSVLAVVQIFQIGLFAGLTFALWLICLRSPFPRLLVLLAASPAFFLIFWAGDRQGTMRKEMFFLIALALLTLAALRPGPARTLPVIALVAFTLGCIGNTLHSFLAPAMLAGFWILAQAGRISPSQFKTYSAIAIAMAIFWLVIAMIFREVPRLDGICAPLVARGLSGEFCGGAIYWLVTDAIDHNAHLIYLLTPERLGRFAIVTMLSLGPVVLCLRVLAPTRLVLWFAVVTFIPMLPLYVVATDWGRWFSTSYSGFGFLIIMAVALGQLQIKWYPHKAMVAGMLGIALLLSHAHGINWKLGGAIQAIMTTTTELQ